MPIAPRVAVVIEDDADIRTLLATVLEQVGFETVLTGNGLDGIEAVRTHDPIVTTLDVSMPGIDGFETAKRIRAISSTYLIMLTARTEEIDTLQGLESGADDYVTKPFRPRELRARIEAMLRRAEATPSSGTARVPTDATRSGAAESTHPRAVAAPVPTRVVTARDVDEAARTGRVVDLSWYEHRGLRLNSDEHRVVVGSVDVELTHTEFRLLEGLMRSGRRVLSKAALAELVRSEADAFYVSEADKRAVEVHLANLRRKLGDNPVMPRFIETVRGVGYRLTSNGENSGIH
ncbi:response regulator transcription factor [Homoserinimonas sp. OAct 916]|uniref:response regulator transcription factor n=1 Tax=Homoserinimonas sp. OAct 916 TaxID=2211450 RepID=UPI000DBE9839|nr:response regulator transcription factor [Homoserinimonas sp. OAct 916]